MTDISSKRIEELGHVELGHGVYKTTTFVDGVPMTVEERYKALKESK